MYIVILSKLENKSASVEGRRANLAFRTLFILY